MTKHRGGNKIHSISYLCSIGQYISYKAKPTLTHSARRPSQEAAGAAAAQEQEQEERDGVGRRREQAPTAHGVGDLGAARARKGPRVRRQALQALHVQHGRGVLVVLEQHPKAQVRLVVCSSLHRSVRVGWPCIVLSSVRAVERSAEGALAARCFPLRCCSCCSCAARDKREPCGCASGPTS